MTPAQIGHFHRKLVERSIALLRTVNRDLHDSVVERAYRLERSEDVGDAGEDDRLEDTKLRLDERAGAEVRAIEAALDRMRIGKYGRCVDCDGEIPRERLEALPSAERCELDQERIELERGQHAPTL